MGRERGVIDHVIAVHLIRQGAHTRPPPRVAHRPPLEDQVKLRIGSTSTDCTGGRETPAANQVDFAA